MFVTVWLDILTLSTGILVAANAGHEYPAMRLGKEGFRINPGRHGLIMGIMEGIPYREESWRLLPGSSIFLYTDGITEATDAEENMFTKERLARVLGEIEAESTPEMITQRVYTAVKDFVGSAPQFDDMTMLVLNYQGGGEILLSGD